MDRKRKETKDVKKFGSAAEDWLNLVMTSGLFAMVAKKAYPIKGMKAFEERLGKLSANQVRLFGHILATAPNGVRVNKIAHDMDITAAAASQTVERLVALGMLERTQDPNDRRAAIITAAAEGREFFEGVKARSASLLGQIYADIGVSKDELAAFAAVLAKIREALSVRWLEYLNGKAGGEKL
ncbi:MAG: winged helix-turn-helix transcriptional regulator [Kiritimatiellae bacterium]|nr:winged helix-turn-helix transcriptional regulator [Kiritimatiellia bacterium]